ncbi:uncharacterized protein LOC133287715 [Gastrolobium bilobum]|uniref:uncharacterized protein LOC133287715 n=1 Tax=Gastrolobium bilobum TaxID=150636 RepID=UPI002AB0D3F8|nr:uncharacterized protein LOC133287715 [Gastrolobium bilobum]
MLSNLNWQIGNRSKIAFWKDNWTGLSSNLITLSIAPPSAEETDLKINHSSFVSEEGWNVQYIEHHFNLSVVNRIMAVPHPEDVEGEDYLMWNNWKLAPSSCRDRIWSWKVKERVKFLMWKLFHERMPTKENIAKWSDSLNSCPSCPDKVETCLHVFRDCQKAVKAPAQGFLKLNVDGASLDSRAACGGLLRDCKGSWISGFSAFVGFCSPLQAELWAILKGLIFASNNGWKNIMLESDSLQAISLFTNVGNDTRKIPLVAKIQVFLNKDLTVLL